MDLELSTTEDMINELRKRKMRFVFIGAINTNTKTAGSTMVASQATDRKDIFRLIGLGVNEFRRPNYDDTIDNNNDQIELDQDG